GLDPIVHLTHAMEDRFVMAQGGDALASTDIDRMLAATDWLAKIQAVDEAKISSWLEQNAAGVDSCAAGFQAQQDPALSASDPGASSLDPPLPPEIPPSTFVPTSVPQNSGAASASAPAGAKEDAPAERDIFAKSSKGEIAARERSVRITADRFDYVLSLSAETLVSARQLASWGEVLERSQRTIGKTQQLLEDAPDSVATRSA